MKSAEDIKTKSRTELAVEAITPEMLKRCEGMPPAPTNTVGDLLQDGTTAMTLLAACRARNNALIDYIAPVVEAERMRK